MLRRPVTCLALALAFVAPLGAQNGPGIVGNYVIRDFKYAIRSFVRRPLFTAVIVLTLALGIGSNVAMFSVANAVLLRALPYDHPEQLALVWTRLQATNVESSLVSGPDLKDYQTQTTKFEGFGGRWPSPARSQGADRPSAS